MWFHYNVNKILLVVSIFSQLYIGLNSLEENLDPNYLTQQDVNRWTKESEISQFKSTLNLRTVAESKEVDPDSDEFKMMYRAATYASIVACYSSGLQSWNCQRCQGVTMGTQFIEWFEFNKTETAGYIAVQPSEKSIIIAFRGSHNAKNWFNDFRFWSRKLPWTDAPPSVRVHTGFYSTYKAAQEFLKEKITSLIKQYPAYHIDVVGHSLGGALAVLASLDIKANILPLLNLDLEVPVYLYTSGQPRVGNADFVEYYHKYFPDPYFLHRIVNHQDLYPHLPPSSIGYRHIAPEYWITGDQNKTRICSQTNGEDPHCSNSIPFYELSSNFHNFLWDLKMGNC